jgi:hypothetical protein
VQKKQRSRRRPFAAAGAGTGSDFGLHLFSITVAYLKFPAYNLKTSRRPSPPGFQEPHWQGLLALQEVLPARKRSLSAPHYWQAAGSGGADTCPF